MRTTPTIKYRICMCAIIICFSIGTALAQDYETNIRPGAHIQRTMKLLEESTPLKKNTVRILFYGQSITAQNWWKEVAEDLMKRYPYANIIIKNRAIGGFTAPRLVYTAEYDLYPEYPDLLIFHDYGCTDDGKYEDIIRRTRERTTSEIILITHHDIGLEKNYKESELIRKIAVKYNCGLVDMELQWQEKLRKTGLEYKDLLSNSPHLNTKGNEWYADFMKGFLRYDQEIENNEMEKCVTFISFDDDRFVKRMDDGSIEVQFTGNRIDAIPADNRYTGTMGEVYIDSCKPSDFPGAYSFTRPSIVPYGWMPALLKATHNTPLITEDWTLQVIEGSSDGQSFRFRVTGSVTGIDGEGTNEQPFTSKSGRVVIENDENWLIGWWLDLIGDKTKEMPTDFKVMWRVEPHFNEILAFPNYRFDGTDNAVTLIKGISNGRHVLRIVPLPGSQIRLKGFSVYCPPLANTNIP